MDVMESPCTGLDSNFQIVVLFSGDADQAACGSI